MWLSQRDNKSLGAQAPGSAGTVGAQASLPAWVGREEQAGMPAFPGSRFVFSLWANIISPNLNWIECLAKADLPRIV
jgi:hypothetical protein